jgi:hypothetical protein
MPNVQGPKIEGNSPEMFSTEGSCVKLPDTPIAPCQPSLDFTLA